MPRNSGGTYTLPAGNPVITGTVISSTWANTTLTDIGTALTDSLSRSGQGSMIAPLLLSDGAIGAPGLSWGNETTSGLYRPSAGDFRYAIAGTDRLQIATGVRVLDGSVGVPGLSFISDTDTGFFHSSANTFSAVAGGFSGMTWQTNGAITQSLVSDGSVGVPSLSFVADTDSGIFRAGANRWQLVAGGVGVIDVQSTQVVSFVNFYVPDGLVGTPSYSFGNDSDTGLYRVAANNIGISAGGVNTVQFIATASQFLVQIQTLDGSAAAPSHSFFNDPDTGLYRPASGRVRIIGNATVLADFDQVANNVTFNVPFYSVDGNAGAPGITFGSDTDTGLYRVGANTLGFSAGGGLIFQYNTTGIQGIDGTPTNPMYTFTGSTNTGIYRPAASTQVGVVCNGTVAAVFGSAGQQLGNAGDAWFLGLLSSATATAGGGAALPATVAGFWQVTINGTIRKIPYYAN